MEGRETEVHRLLQAARNRYESFQYDLGWSDWVGYVDGWIPRLALSVPIVGYLILFNDALAGSLDFFHLTGNRVDEFGLSGVQRLRCVYFGLIALGLANLVYRLAKPGAFKLGTDAAEYTRVALELFTYQEFEALHVRIRSEGHRTQAGDYDDDWNHFRDQQEERTGWEKLKGGHGDLLRSILRDTFFRQNTVRRGWLLLCLALSSLGYMLLAVPSGDLFLKVLRSTWS